MSSNKNLIHTKMRLVRDEAWFHTSWIYETPYSAEKQDFWQWISNELLPTDALWLSVGDLNEIFSDAKNGGPKLYGTCGS